MTEPGDMTPAASEESVCDTQPNQQHTYQPPSSKKDQDKSKRGYMCLIKDAINAMKSRTGSSRKAIMRHVLANTVQTNKAKAEEYANKALKRMLQQGVLQLKSGKYRLVDRSRGSKFSKKKALKAKMKKTLKKAVRGSRGGGGRTPVRRGAKSLKDQSKAALAKLKAKNKGKLVKGKGGIKKAGLKGTKGVKPKRALDKRGRPIDKRGRPIDKRARGFDKRRGLDKRNNKMQKGRTRPTKPVKGTGKRMR